MIKVNYAKEKRKRDKKRRRVVLQIGCIVLHLTQKERQKLIKDLKKHK